MYIELFRQLLTEDAHYDGGPDFHHGIFHGTPNSPQMQGGHSPSDTVRQASNVVDWEKSFDPEYITLPYNSMVIYKVKNFGNPNIKNTNAMFQNTKDFRTAFDLVYGAGGRNGKHVFWRIITSGKRTEEFWEFSFDGSEWYILKPNPVQTLKPSKFQKRVAT